MNIKTNKLCYFTIYWKWGDVRNGIVLGETLQKGGEEFKSIYNKMKFEKFPIYAWKSSRHT